MNLCICPILSESLLLACTMYGRCLKIKLEPHCIAVHICLNSDMRLFEEPSGRVLDLRLRGLWFQTLRKRCVVFLSKTIYPLLSTGSTQEISKHG